MNVSRLVASLAALATTTSALAGGLICAEDYGMGAFATIEAWQAAGGSTGAAAAPTAAIEPMDYGVGSFATIAAWEQAGAAAPTQTALAARAR